MEFKEMFDFKEDKNASTYKKKETNFIKQIGIRLGIIIGTIALIFITLYLVDKRSGALGALYLSFYFFCLWLFYLIIETVMFYILKKSIKGNTNLIFIIIIVLISAFIFSKIA